MTSWFERLRPGGPEQGGTTRAPVLSPAPAGWLGLPLVRGLRVLVRDGALLVQRPDGPVEQRAAAGEVTRVGVLAGADLAVHAPRGRARSLPYDAGVLVALAGTRPVLALAPDEWVPGPVTAELSGRDARRLSGADALAAALGVPVEPLGAGDVAGARLDLLAARPRPTRRRRWLTRAAVAVFAVFVAVLATLDALSQVRSDGGRLEYPLALSALASLVCGAFAVDAVLRRRRAAALVAASPVAERATWRPVPGVPVARAFRERAALRVGPDEVAVRDAEGREAWLPGPARGGVDRALLTDDLLVLADADGQEHLALPLSAWAGTAAARDDLTRALETAGLRRASGLASARPPVFAPGHSAGPLDLEWLGGLREHTGLPTTNQVFAVTAVSALVVPACLSAGGAVGAVVAAPAAFALLVGVGGGAVRWLTGRRERRLEAP